MIQGFEQYTGEFNEEERMSIPHIIRLLENARGKSRAISNKRISAILEHNWGYKLSGPRIRKVVNLIRNKGILQNVLANSRGYWISNDLDEITFYIQSLHQRSDAILSVAHALAEQRRRLEQNS